MPTSASYRPLLYYLGYESAVNGERSHASKLNRHDRTGYTAGFTEGQLATIVASKPSKSRRSPARAPAIMNKTSHAKSKAILPETRNRQRTLKFYKHQRNRLRRRESYAVITNEEAPVSADKQTDAWSLI